MPDPRVPINAPYPTQGSPTAEAPPAPTPIASAPFQPYSPGPGVQPGTATLQGVDMTQPGAGETFQANNAQGWNTPGAAETFANQTAQQYSPGNTPQVSNNAQGAYSQFQAQAPADIDPYYAYQRQQLNNTMNTQLASRGAYGSSVGLGTLATGQASLGAQEANANAQYGLQRAATAGNLARGADTSSLASSNNDLGWLQGLGGIAGQGESGMLSRLNSGESAALQAQGAQRNRGQDFFNNELSMGNTFSGMMGDTYGQMFSGDTGLLEDALGGRAAGAAEAYGQSSSQTNGLNDLYDAGGKVVADYLKKNGSGSTSTLPANPAGDAPGDYGF